MAKAWLRGRETATVHHLVEEQPVSRRRRALGLRAGEVRRRGVHRVALVRAGLEDGALNEPAQLGVLQRMHVVHVAEELDEQRNA